MSEYSEQSQKLAKELAEKAAKNLRRSGRLVIRNATTGHYVVSHDADATPKSDRPGSSNGTIESLRG